MSLQPVQGKAAYAVEMLPRRCSNWGSAVRVLKRNPDKILCLQQAQIRQALVGSLALSLGPDNRILGLSPASNHSSSQDRRGKHAREAEDRALLSSHRGESRQVSAHTPGSSGDGNLSSGSNTPRARYAEDRALLASHRGERRGSNLASPQASSIMTGSSSVSTPRANNMGSRDAEDRALLSSQRGERKSTGLYRSVPLLKRSRPYMQNLHPDMNLPLNAAQIRW